MTPIEVTVVIIPFTLGILYIGYMFGKTRTERRFNREVKHE